MKQKYKKPKDCRSGFVILFAMVFSAILLAVGLGVANIALKEISFSTSARATNDSFLAADTGVECALYNDKRINNVFSVESGVSVQCLGASISATYAKEGSFNTWSFVIKPNAGNLGQKYCSVVKVKKDTNLYYDTTDIISKGYNFADNDNANCTSSNPQRVERELDVSSITNAKVASDNFTQASDVELSTHTPTGPNSGSGWVVQILNGVITNKSTGNIIDDKSGNGNRYKMNDNLDGDQMDVQADFTSTGTKDSPVFFGLMGRLPYATGTTGIEGYYDHGVNGGSWVISDGTNPASTTTGSLPAAPFTIKLEIRTGVSKLYVNGDLKVTRNTNKFPGQNYAGIMLGNWTGAVGKVTADNYQSIGF